MQYELLGIVRDVRTLRRRNESWAAPRGNLMIVLSMSASFGHSECVLVAPNVKDQLAKSPRVGWPQKGRELRPIIFLRR